MVAPPLCALLLAAVPQQGSPASLEGFLARARAECERIQAELATRIPPIIAKLEDGPGKLQLEDIRAELARLGPEAAPLLVPYLEPGPSGEDPESSTLERKEARATEIARELERTRPAGIVGDLAAASATGSTAGQRNAIRVLGHVPERERAAARLAVLFETTTGEVRVEAARSLARQGVRTDLLGKALSDPEIEVVRTVIASLADSRNAEAAPAVLRLTRDARAAAPVAGGIARYWDAVPAVVDVDVVTALLVLVMRTDAKDEDRIKILEVVPRFEASREREVRRMLDPVQDLQHQAIREAALVCGSLLGDRSARRELLAPYDEIIQTSKDWWKGYEQRGNLLLRVEDYTGAIKDLEEALDRLREDGRARGNGPTELWVSIARCQMRLGKINKAAEALTEAALDPKRRAALRADPDFAELLAHPRYGLVLQ